MVSILDDDESGCDPVGGDVAPVGQVVVRAGEASEVFRRTCKRVDVPPPDQVAVASLGPTLHLGHAVRVTVGIDILIADDGDDVARNVLHEILLRRFESFAGAREIVEAISPGVVLGTVRLGRQGLSVNGRPVCGEVGTRGRIAVNVADMDIRWGVLCHGSVSRDELTATAVPSDGDVLHRGILGRVGELVNKGIQSIKRRQRGARWMICRVTSLPCVYVRPGQCRLVVLLRSPE